MSYEYETRHVPHISAMSTHRSMIDAGWRLAWGNRDARMTFMVYRREVKIIDYAMWRAEDGL